MNKEREREKMVTNSSHNPPGLLSLPSFDQHIHIY